MSISSAFRKYSAEYDNSDVLYELLDTRTEAWRALLSEEISGRILDTDANYGKRSLLFAELGTEVHAVDQRFSGLIVLQRIASSRELEIYPFHTGQSQLPYPDQMFDTIFARTTPTSLRNQLSVLEPLLKRSGTIIFESHGWPREMRLTDILGIEHDQIKRDNSIQGILKGLLFLQVRALRDQGFDSIRVLARLSKGNHRNQVIFDINNSSALAWLLSQNITLETSVGNSFLKKVTSIGDKLGILQLCFPEYLIVAKKDSEIALTEGIDILLAGKNRSVGLELSNERVQGVVKYPNSRRQSIFNRIEDRVLTGLGDVSRIAETLPNGSIEDTKMGTTRYERPVSGTTLADIIEKDVNSFNRSASIALDWIIRLQADFSTDKQWRTENEVFQELSIPGVDPHHKAINQWKLFTSPVHGDFFGTNILVKSGQVTKVIDWERSSLAENPIIDPAYFLLQYADFLGDDFEDGLYKLILNDSQYTAAVRSFLSTYYNAVNISHELFISYLPYPYIRLYRMDTTINYWTDTDWSKRVQLLWDNYDRILTLLNPV